MSRHLRQRRLLSLAALTLVWCGLWRDVSIANLLAGLLIACVVTASGVGTPGRGGIRMWPLLQLIWLVMVDLAKSTINVAVEIVTPTDRTDEAIVAVDIPADGRDHLLLLVVAITLTPGTAVVDADPDTATLYLHLLHHRRRTETVEHVDELVRLASEALPTPPIGALP